jgi:hypothetical protein
MRTRAPETALAAAAAIVGVFAVGSMALTSWVWTDYDAEARPAFDALMHGHLERFLSLAPAYGGSLVLRAPFVAATSLWGGGELSIFRAAAAPCLAAAAVLGVWLFAKMRALGRPLGAAAVAVLLCVANPLIFPALEYGHPEELLGAVLCVAAVLTAMRGRPVWAGVLLGLAVANKEWALLAAGPVLVALPRRRAVAVASAVGAGALLLGPLMLARPEGVAGQTAAASGGNLFHPWQLWWFLGVHGHPAGMTAEAIRSGYRAPVAWVESIAHPLIVALALPLTLLYAGARRRGGGRATDPVLLLALLLALRFLLDPWDNVYYPLPFLFALLAWEALAHERVPILALAASLGAWFALQETARAPLSLSADGQALVFLALSLPAVAAIAMGLYAPRTCERLRSFARRRPALAAAA